MGGRGGREGVVSTSGREVGCGDDVVVIDKARHENIILGRERSRQEWEHALEQHVAACTFSWYSRGLHLAIPQAHA